MVAFVVQSGPAEGRRVEVEKELVIGREDADVTLEDAEISRRHALVRPTASGLEIEDLGSTNGTHVNGMQIAEMTTVQDGATILLGKTTLVVEAPTPASATVVSSVPTETVARATSDATPALAQAEEFGAFRTAPARRRRAATRLFVPMLLTYAAVGGTAAALIIYFLQR